MKRSNIENQPLLSLIIQTIRFYSMEFLSDIHRIMPDKERTIQMGLWHTDTRGEKPLVLAVGVNLQ